MEPNLAASLQLERDRRGAAHQRRHLPSGIATGVAVDTALFADPSGNPVELFEPRAGYHERTTTKE